MDTVTTENSGEKTWGGNNEPMAASYGKLMMWFFIVSDALTFSGFLAAYGFSRFKFIETWPLAEEVFTHFPFMHGVAAPMAKPPIAARMPLIPAMRLMSMMAEGAIRRERSWTIRSVPPASARADGSAMSKAITCSTVSGE